MRILVVLVFCLIGLATSPGAADDVVSAQAVISSQLEAIGRDDADAAYAHAAPAIQEMFSSPDIFMAMVRQGYAPLYRPQRFEFGKAVSADGKTAQQVHVVDADGVAWEALYTLERQPDGSLKITGCSLVKADQGA